MQDVSKLRRRSFRKPVSKRVFGRNHSYVLSKGSFSYKSNLLSSVYNVRFHMRPRFETEAQGNSEMSFLPLFSSRIFNRSSSLF